MIQNSVRPDVAFFVKPDTVIVNDAGYDWKTIIEGPVLKDNKKNQIEVKVENLRCRKTPNGQILGFVEKGFYNILDSKVNGKYTWYKIGESNFIAYDSSWATLHPISKENPKTENKEEKPSESVQDSVTSDKKNLTKIFTCMKDDTYYLKLYQGEVLYIENKKSS